MSTIMTTDKRISCVFLVLLSDLCYVMNDFKHFWRSVIGEMKLQSLH